MELETCENTLIHVDFEVGGPGNIYTLYYSVWHQKQTIWAQNGTETHCKVLGSKPQGFWNEIEGIRKIL